MESLLPRSDTNVDISALPVSGDSTRSHSESKPDGCTDTLLAPRRSVSLHSKCSHGATRAFLKRPWFFEWSWEVGSILVSIVCMSLIAGILFSMDGKPARMWKLPIQPNSLVAVFSTVAKSALLVPIAESIGQLKWDFFKPSRPLVHMQALDEASRGPWGAITLLWKTRCTSLLTASGAIITILLLTFEPFTQQVIEIKNQRAILTNTSGFVSTTNTFKAEVRQDLTEWLPRGLLVEQSKSRSFTDLCTRTRLSHDDWHTWYDIWTASLTERKFLLPNARMWVGRLHLACCLRLLRE